MEITTSLDSLKRIFALITEEVIQGYCSKSSLSVLLCQFDALKHENQKFAFFLSMFRVPLLGLIKAIDVYKLHLEKIQSDNTSDTEIINIIRKIYELDFDFPEKDIIFLNDSDRELEKTEEIKHKMSVNQNQDNVKPMVVDDFDENEFIYLSDLAECSDISSISGLSSDSMSSRNSSKLNS